MKKEKRTFSHIDYPFFSYARKMGKKQPGILKNLKNQADKIYRDGSYSSENKEQLQREAIAIFLADESIQDIKNNKFLNYYIPSKLLGDFLVTSGIKNKQYIEIENIIRNFVKNNDSDHIMGCCHFNNSVFKKSIFFFFGFHENDDISIITDGHITLLQREKKGFEKFLHQIFNDPKYIGSKNFYLAILNLFYYMSAFPDCITDKPPMEIMDKLNKDNSKTISLNSQIEEYMYQNKDIMPHLRRGHFRFLSNDRFINKKGQTIFINPSFVKGHAKTILEKK